MSNRGLGVALLLGALVLWYFYVPVKAALFRLGVPSNLTPILPLSAVVVLLVAGIWLFRRRG
jgi:hypothetical protein